MNVIARVNDTIEFQLRSWDAITFAGDLTLRLQCGDFDLVRTAFEHVDKLEIIVDNMPVGTYTNLDTFAQIAYVGREYIDDTNSESVDVMTVLLTKRDIVSQIDRMDEQINPVIDITNMDMEELLAYKLSLISKDCENDVYAGDNISLEDGSTQLFTYKFQDQVNLDELLVLAMLVPEMERYPYHRSMGDCTFYSRNDVIRITTMLLLRKTRLTTYCNQLNQYLRSVTDRNILMGAYYGMELPQEYIDRMNEIMAGTIEQMEAFIHRILPPTIEENSENSENGEDGESGENSPDDPLDPSSPFYVEEPDPALQDNEE